MSGWSETFWLCRWVYWESTDFFQSKETPLRWHYGNLVRDIGIIQVTGYVYCSVIRLWDSTSCLPPNWYRSGLFVYPPWTSIREIPKTSLGFKPLTTNQILTSHCSTLPFHFFDVRVRPGWGETPRGLTNDFKSIFFVEFPRNLFFEYLDYSL